MNKAPGKLMSPIKNVIILIHRIYLTNWNRVVGLVAKEIINKEWGLV
jgi:hypothetical protein